MFLLTLIIHFYIMKKLFFLLVFIFCSCGQNDEWQNLFDGESLDGWEMKIRYHDFGENYNNTFKTKDGEIVVSHEEYDEFEEKFGHILPANYLATQTNTWHIKGASLPAHTDMHCLTNANKKFNKDYRNCLTWQLYLPDTDQYPQSGVWLHGEWDDNISGREKIKQISCLPGTFFFFHA